MMRTTPRALGALLLPCLFFLAGCEEPVAQTPSGGNRPAVQRENRSAPPQPIEPVRVEANSYPNVEAAVAALLEASTTRDRDQLQLSMGWLARQGAAAVPPLTRALNDEQVDINGRLSACRALAEVGPPGLDPVLACLDSKEPMLRLRAVEMLGGIQPAEERSVDALLALLEADDTRLGSAAIRSLGRLGTKAEKATPKLLAILNSPGDEGLRSAASDALRKVNPRRRFDTP